MKISYFFNLITFIMNKYVITILYDDYNKCLFLIEDKDVKTTNMKIRAHNLLENETIQ